MDATLEQQHAEAMMADHGETVTVYTGPSDETGVEVTAIVSRGGSRLTERPRAATSGVTIEVYNNATTGIDPDAWHERYEIGYAETPGHDDTVRRRTLRRTHRNSATTTYEMG